MDIRQFMKQAAFLIPEV